MVISNVFSDDNRGGAAITAGAIETARRAFPECTISLVTVTAPNDELYRHTKRRYPGAEILPPLVEVGKGPLTGTRALIRSLLILASPGRYVQRRTVSRIAEASIVIGKGGQLFSPKRRMRGLAGFWMAILPLVLARRLGIRTAFHGITIGPYPPRALAATLAGWILRRVDLVLVRDARSYEEARALGVDPLRLDQVPDAAFSLSPSAKERAQELSQELGLGQNAFGALTITTSRGAHDYELFEFLENVVREVLERRIIQEMLVVLQTDGPTASDRLASQTFVDRLGHPNVRLLDRDLSPEELMSLYGSAAFTVGCRLHSAILSLIAGTPAFPISRTTTVKADDVFRTLGLEQFVVRIGGTQEAQVVLARRLVDAIQAVVTEGQGARDKINAATATLRQTQDVAVRGLRALIGRAKTD